MRLEEAKRELSGDFRFPVRRITVSGLRVGGICFECECRVLEIHGDPNITLAWCDCDPPEDHHEMEIL